MLAMIFYFACYTLCRYVPREWMLAMGYEAAQKGDHSITQELFDLFAAPYDEQPDFEAKYEV